VIISDTINDGVSGRTLATRLAETSGAPSSLPPVDGGRRAWIFLAACFMLEGVAWGRYWSSKSIIYRTLIDLISSIIGFPYSFGVFNRYYSSHSLFSGSSASVATIGTTATGVAYFASPVFSIAMQRWPRTRGPSMLVGLAIMVAALIGASFASSIPELLATQGVMYALGCTLLYMPSNLYVGEWFVRKRGLAFGVVWAGTG
jgi:MFS family permease